MDFSQLTAVGNANPTGQDFDLQWYKGKGEFRFSDKLFASMQLEYNSLTQFDDPEGKIIIAVMPGNTGVFYKKNKGAAKGKRFKNIRLSEACDAAGFTTNKLTCEHLGSNNGAEYYEVKPAGADQTPIEEAAEQPVDDMPWPEEEAVASNVTPNDDF